jgi:hypothetical protein
VGKQAAGCASRHAIPVAHAKAFTVSFALPLAVSLAERIAQSFTIREPLGIPAVA